MTPNDTPEPGQFPAPLPPPPGGLLHLIMRHRFLIVSLVVVLFFGLLFAWGGRRGGLTPPKPAESSVAAAPHGGPAPTAPKEQAQELKPLIPAPPKGTHGATPPTPSPQGTPEPTLAPAPPQAGSSHVPPASPVPVTPPREPVKGEVFTQALVKIIEDQVNKPWFGWRPNTIVFGKMGLTDNANNLQLGVLEWPGAPWWCSTST